MQDIEFRFPYRDTYIDVELYKIGNITQFKCAWTHYEINRNFSGIDLPTDPSLLEFTLRGLAIRTLKGLPSFQKKVLKYSLYSVPEEYYQTAIRKLKMFLKDINAN